MNQWPVNALSAFVGVGGSLPAGRGADRGAAEAGTAPVQEVSPGVRGKGVAARREVDGGRGRADFRQELSKRAELSRRGERAGAVERVSRDAALERTEKPESPTGDRGEPPEGGAKGEMAPRLAGLGAGVEAVEGDAEVPGAVVTEAEPGAVRETVEVRPTGAKSDERAEGDEGVEDDETVDGRWDAPQEDDGTDGAAVWMPVRVEADAVEVVVSEGVIAAVPEVGVTRVGGWSTGGAVSAGVTGLAVTTAKVLEAGGAETAGGQTAGGQKGEQRSDQPKPAVLEASREEVGVGREVRSGRWETLTQARPGAEGRQEVAQGDGTGETGHGAARPGQLGVSAGLPGSSGVGVTHVQPMVVEAKPWAGTSDASGGPSPMAKLDGVTAAVGPGSGSTVVTGTPRVEGTSPLSYAPEMRFHAANGPGILQAVRAQLLPNGGTMTMRLDPPEMGALQVAVVLKDGLASVTFRAENPEAVRLLSQTMAQLRETLSAAGLTVDRMQVQQGSRQEGTGTSGERGTHGDRGGQGQPGGGGLGGFQMQDEQARREQQRRELLERLWLKAAGVDSGVMA